MNVLIYLIVLIISQYIHTLSHHVTYLKHVNNAVFCTEKLLRE